MEALNAIDNANETTKRIDESKAKFNKHESNFYKALERLKTKMKNSKYK
jgi:hypothetical protein